MAYFITDIDGFDATVDAAHALHPQSALAILIYGCNVPTGEDFWCPDCQPVANEARQRHVANTMHSGQVTIECRIPEATSYKAPGCRFRSDDRLDRIRNGIPFEKTFDSVAAFALDAACRDATGA